MHGLHELQRDFARSVLQGGVAVGNRIRPNGLTAAQRLAVYRNNTFMGLTEALRDGYPVVHRLVGDGFFNRLASAYVARHPPQSGCLLEYGGHFPAFVAEYRPAHGLPYLADVARLEWLWQVAFHEAGADGLDLTALADVPTECHEELRLRLHPTVRLMVSDYPVLRIWENNQAGHAGDDRISLQEGGCRLLVNQHGKITRFPGKSTLIFFHPGVVQPSGVFAGVTWGVRYGIHSRNQTASFGEWGERQLDCP